MARATTAADPQPERTAFRIVPATGRIRTTVLTDNFQRLHGIDPSFRLEWRMVARSGTITYYVIADADDQRTVEHVLRRVFPDETRIETAPLPTPPDEPTAAVELLGYGERRDDWQTRLTPVIRDEDDDEIQFPLAAVVDTLSDADVTLCYQSVLAPKADWRGDAEFRVDQLLRNRDTPGQRWFDFLVGEYAIDPDIEDASPSHRDRIAEIRDVDARRSFTVNARAVASGPDAERALEELGNAFQPVCGAYYDVQPRLHTDQEAVEAILEKLENVECVETQGFTTRLKQRVPLTGNASPAIVTDSKTAPNFCLLDGESLTAEGRRAVQATPDEQTGVPRPDDDLLAQYDAGMVLGRPLTDDDTVLDTSVSLPPALQPLHVAWFGKTGSGKSTALLNAMLENHAETDGLDVIIDPKGDGMPREYLRAHYARYGSLENVYYFDCAETLPAISFFDLRGQLADGIDRTTAVEDVVDHYTEILVGVMGRERFEAAVRSPDIITYLVKAMFDPVHGADAFSDRDLQEAANRMHETRDPPPVVDPDLQRMLSGVAANSRRSFDELMQGVANRIEKIPLDDRLGMLFNHVPEDGNDPHFDFREFVDEDAVVIFDTGGLRPESQRTLTLVLLSQLWSALRRRTRHSDADHPLVNLYLEEAAEVTGSGLVTDLLAQSRAFGLSMTLAMQFPAQLELADAAAYGEVLNNVSTVVTGNVAVDDDLAKRLATEDMPPAEVANRLRALRRGQWFASLPSRFGVDEPRPFLLESAPLPPGHPEGEAPFSEDREAAFEAAVDVVEDRTRLEYGLDVRMKQGRATLSQGQGQDSTATGPAETAGSDTSRDEDVRIDSALPYTKRMPQPVEYAVDKHALVCSECENRFDPTADGMRNAIACCHTLDAVHRDDIPICELNLKLSAAERRQSPYSDAQLRFLQAVYMAHQRQFDEDLAYDLLEDSMVRLQEYVGVSQDEVQTLLDAGLLAEDCTYPHKLYTVTAMGREVAKIDYTEGVGFGHGEGDLGESSLHVMMVEVGRRFLVQSFLEDPDSSVEKVVAYYEHGDHRFDVVGLDADGEMVVVVEAERLNHDRLTAVPDDYDKMAAVEPEEAIWIVKNREDAHKMLTGLNDPKDGEPRIDKTYSRNTSPQQFKLDFDGLTELYTMENLRRSLES